MRAAIALLVAAIGLGAVSAAAGTSAPRPSSALVPSAVAFSDRLHGVLGFGSPSCHGCRARGAIAVTSNGGDTWRVVRHTPRRVIGLTRYGSMYLARYDDGEILGSRNGRTWRPTVLTTADINSEFSICPQGTTVGTVSGAADWSLCTTEPSAGNQGKAVYRNLAHGWVRVACTTFLNLAPCSQHSSGGISSYGYPIGIAGSAKGFGIIWESRGTLYVTRDGGHQWFGLPKVAQPEIDFGSWAFVLPRGGVGFVILERFGRSRLIETTDAGLTWRVVHRWR